MTVLVTDPTSATGQYIVERVLPTDQKVRVLALPETLHRIPYRNQVEIVAGSPESEEAILEAVSGVDIIYHAALIAPPPNRSPNEFRRFNTEGTRRLLEACAGEIKRFVLVSTNQVYKVHFTPDTWPVRADAERDRPAPGNRHLTPYSQSMIDAEDFVVEASATYGMEYAILRPTIVCGRTANFVERLMSWLIRDSQRAALQIHAIYPNMQWIHGSDLARAALLAGTRPEAKNQAYIVAGKEPVTAYGLLATFWDITHPQGGSNPYAQAHIEHRPPMLKFDIGKIRDELGFEPEITLRECLGELLGRYDFFSSSSLEMPRQPTALEFDPGIAEVPFAFADIPGPASIPARSVPAAGALPFASSSLEQLARLPNAPDFYTGIEAVDRSAGPASIAAGSVPAAAALPPDFDMRGKTCVITGATSGIGLATAEALAVMGAKLVLVGRNREKVEGTLKHLRELAPRTDARMYYGDLSSLADMRRVAQEILASTPRIDVLINNVGAIFGDHEITLDGLERTFAVNHMSHFLLTMLLRDRLVASAPARIVTVASSGHRGIEIDLDDLQGERNFDSWVAAKRSKLYNILFTRELARRLSDTGVTANCLCPGFIATGIGDNTDARAWNRLARAKKTHALSPAQGASNLLYVACSPEIAAISGGYFENSRLMQPSPAARDENASLILWEKSIELAGLSEDLDAPRPSALADG
jgi:NAD(P)-dependent dehydrogenase (short-subunit alcohol dehydrogenase family)/uncharacterized protein YbjT (DUF2867 family)